MKNLDSYYTLNLDILVGVNTTHNVHHQSTIKLFEQANIAVYLYISNVV